MSGFPWPIFHRFDRQVVEVVNRIRLLLPSIGIEVLMEVAALVEQADADQRQTEVAGRFEVISRQDSQPAGVIRNALRQAELRRKIGDPDSHGLGVRAGEPTGAGKVLVQIGGRPVHLRQESLIDGSSASRLWSIRPSIRRGLCPVSSHRSGSSVRNSSMVGWCHDQRRFKDSLFRHCRRAGKRGVT